MEGPKECHLCFTRICDVWAEEFAKIADDSGDAELAWSNDMINQSIAHEKLAEVLVMLANAPASKLMFKRTLTWLGSAEPNKAEGRRKT